MAFLLFVILGIVYYYFFYKRTKDLLNPIGIMLIVWCLASGLSTLYLAPLQTKWNFEMYFIVIGSSFAIFLAGYMIIPKSKNTINLEKLKISNTFILTTRIIFLISFICFLLEWRYNSYILPGLSISSNNIDLKSQIVAIPVLHYGVIILPYCAMFAFYELKVEKRIKIIPIVIIFVSLVFYAFLFQMSRGTILLIILGIVYIQHIFRPFKLKTILFLSFLCLIFFIFMATLRLAQGSLVFTTLGEGTVMKLISPVYTYVAYSFENLNKLVHSVNEFSFFNSSLKPIWDITGFKEYLTFEEYDTLFFNSRTYLYGYYDDIGFIGTIIFPFLIGIFVSYFYKKSQTKPVYSLMIAVLLKAMIVMFFGNYFFSSFIMIWPFIITGIVIMSDKYKLKY